MKSKKGYIRLYRKIWDNFLFNSDERFDRRTAWIYLIFRANYEEEKVTIRGIVYTISRGQFIDNATHLAEVFRWDRKTVLRFLNLLEREGMITRTTVMNGSIITITNYKEYQDFKASDDSADGTADGTADDTLRGQSVSSDQRTLFNKYKERERREIKDNARARADGRVIE